MQRRTIYVRAGAATTVVVNAETAFDATTVIDLRELDVDTAMADDAAGTATMPAVSVQPTVK